MPVRAMLRLVFTAALAGVAVLLAQPAHGVELLTETEVSKCVELLTGMKPEIRYNALGLAWNELETHERKSVLKNIALLEQGKSSPTPHPSSTASALRCT